MTVKVRIPTPLQKLTEDKAEIEVEACSVAELVEILDEKFKGLKERICEDNGKIRRFINIYVNNEDIRFLENERTKLEDKDEVSIIPAIAGGR
ncbi:MoaD/ThiS family protein [Candidatus Aerophobetes bacterium]|nr:MoaD/ThiS family protein [Candidatus Aerophobetes bacterium]